MPVPSNDLLSSSAALARRLAPQLCRKDPGSGEDCSWYHGLWQDLRLLGLAATPEQQSNYFRQAFARFSGRPLRLLISGSADYAILEHVLSACSEHEVTAKITLVDVCETPLYLNRWYAEKSGAKIETIQADIFKHRFETTFDLICSHGFLSQFSPKQRAELARHWSRALSPDGKVLLINRVRPGTSGTETIFSEKQGREFCELVAEKLRQMHSVDQADHATILARTEIYVQRLIGYTLTEEELTTLLHQAGFKLDDYQIISSGTEGAKLSGPAIPTHAKHACLVASKI